MSENADAQSILAFENYLSGQGFGQDAVEAARSKGWIDGEGRLTEEGEKLYTALVSQADTRSVFRNVI